MYKAIRNIGGYKIGEEVPTDKAEIWLKMYLVPHVEKIDDVDEKSEPEVKEESEPEIKSETSKDVMLDDYLGRNGNVVMKNVKEDALGKRQLKKLLEMEKADKKRKGVIKAIKRRLKG